MESWTRLDPKNKEDCDNLDCFYCRYGHYLQEREYCYKYQEFHKQKHLNTITHIYYFKVIIMSYVEEKEKILSEASKNGIKNLVDVMSDSLSVEGKRGRLLSIITDLQVAYDKTCNVQHVSILEFKR